jgi:hypothetical protein
LGERGGSIIKKEKRKKEEDIEGRVISSYSRVR